MNREQRTMHALFLTLIITWPVTNGVNENEGKGKNREIEPCFTVRVWPRDEGQIIVRLHSQPF